jgi:PAS domain S-box-containing protein
MGEVISMVAVRVGRSLRLQDSVSPVFVHHGGFIVWHSQGLAALLGHNTGPFVGRSVLRFVAPEYAQRTAAVLGRKPARSRLRMELVRADGERVPVEVRGENVVVGGMKARRVEVRVVAASW